nr:DUF4352 domain-containing protein [uncultured Ruminococcus sp.]
MYCTNCGQQQPDNAKFCNNCGKVLQAQQPPVQNQPAVTATPITPPPINQVPVQPAPKQRKHWYARWWVWVIIGVVGTVLIGSIAGRSTPKNTTPKSNNTAAPVVSTVETTAPVQSQEDKPAPTAEQKVEEPSSYSVGDSYEVKGLVMTVDSCQEYVSDNEFLQPEDGNYFLAVHITFQNNSKDDKSVGPGFFKCYVDDKAYDNTYFAGNDYLSYDDLSSGRSSSGTIYYELPINADSIELEYTPSYWSNSKRVIYKLK